MGSNYWNLIAKHLTGEISSEEKNKLLKWSDSDPDNAELLKKAEKLWELSGQHNFEFSPNKKQDWLELKDKILAESPEFRTPTQNRNGVKWFRIAAAMVLLFGVSFILKLVVQQDVVPEQVVYSEPIIYSTPVVYICVETTDSTNVFYLPDSTKIWLNKNSRLLYPEEFSGALRDVELTGEAFFEVVRDTVKPFIVYAGSMQIKVLGTSFNIKAYDEGDEVEVIVIEGKIEFSSRYRRDAKKVVLVIDEKATYKKKENTYTKEKYEGKGFKWRLKDIGKEINQFIRRISKKLKGSKKKKNKK